MKGFLSLLGITLIAGAFGLILLSFSNHPLEELKKKERMHAYMETRQNHPADPVLIPPADASSSKKPEMLKLNFLLDSGKNCENPDFASKKAGSD